MRIYSKHKHGKAGRGAVMEVSLKEIEVLMQGLQMVWRKELDNERTPGKRTGRYRIASPMWDELYKYERDVRAEKEALT